MTEQPAMSAESQALLVREEFALERDSSAPCVAYRRLLRNALFTVAVMGHVLRPQRQTELAAPLLEISLAAAWLGNASLEPSAPGKPMALRAL